MRGGFAPVPRAAEWEMGAAGKYNRVPLPPGLTDSAASRQAWFRRCLDAIGALRLPVR